MNKILGNIKMANIFWKYFKATKIIDGLSGVILLIAVKIGDAVRRPHWLSNKGYLRRGSSGGLIWGLICSLKSSHQYFLSYLKSIASLKGLSAINLSWLRPIKRHNKSSSSTISKDSELRNVNGLIGGINSNTIVDSSYWLEGVSYVIGRGDATTDRPTFTPAINSGEGKTKEALRSGTDDTGKIYGAVWTNAWCDPATGEFTTDSTSDLATIPDVTANLAWDLGSDREYPTLTCLTKNISLDNQRLITSIS